MKAVLAALGIALASAVANADDIDYVKQHSYGNVTTDDFRAVCERTYGKSLEPDTAFAPATIDLPPPGARGPEKGVLVASVVYIERNTPREFGEFFAQQLKSQWEQAGGTVIAQLVSEHSANTYPALPVREKENVFVWLSLFPNRAALDKQQAALAQSTQWREVTGQLTAWTHHKIETLRLEPTARSRLQAP